MFKKNNPFTEVPGVYGARKRLCRPEYGEMFPDYEKMDAE
jgi:hypothetical protein